jgi:hypothetical protein
MGQGGKEERMDIEDPKVFEKERGSPYPEKRIEELERDMEVVKAFAYDRFKNFSKYTTSGNKYAFLYISNTCLEALKK